MNSWPGQIVQEKGSSVSVVEQALADLDRVVTDLAGEYTRPALQGRMEQITSHITGLRSLIEQLPDEELRETEYEGRLLALNDAGDFVRHDHSSDAHARLRYALDARKSVSA